MQWERRQRPPGHRVPFSTSTRRRRRFTQEREEERRGSGASPTAPSRPWPVCPSPTQRFWLPRATSAGAFRAGQPRDLQGEFRVARTWVTSVAAMPATTDAGTPASSQVMPSVVHHMERWGTTCVESLAGCRQSWQHAPCYWSACYRSPTAQLHSATNSINLLKVYPHLDFIQMKEPLIMVHICFRCTLS
nr:uncharacterized protein LOC127300293 isoform X1 [Lolium perenne]